MRTRIEIDDALLAEAMAASGARAKSETVELGLRLLVQVRGQGAVRVFRGKLDWTGDLITRA